MDVMTARDAEPPTESSASSAPLPAPLRIDRFVDDADATIAVHHIVAASPETTYEAARTQDLLEVRTPLTAAAFAVRGIPEKVLRRPAAPPPARLTLEGGLALPGWMLLDQDPGRELVFGAVGVFWTPTIRWNTDVTPETFAVFDDPGWGKIACNYSTLPYGDRRTLLTYECRTVTTDDDSHRRFDRYWWLIRPFVHHIMSATVRTIAANAEHGGTHR
jgi:hypothetical protein